MTFWDYATGTPFQNMEDIPQPGSLDAEAGLFCSTFDMTGTRLITGGADKTIKVRGKLCQMMTPAKILVSCFLLDLRGAGIMIGFANMSVLLYAMLST